MEIARHGAAANHGEKVRRSNDISVRWQPINQKIETRINVGLKDFNTDARYRYYVRHSLDEYGKMTAALANRIADIPPSVLRDELREFVPDLLKLANSVANA